jgi:hypothetical protein
VPQYPAFEKSLERAFDKHRQARAGPGFDLGEEGLQRFSDDGRLPTAISYNIVRLTGYRAGDIVASDGNSRLNFRFTV